jgi:prepilin-type processing-associated H-X9-DG protein
MFSERLCGFATSAAPTPSDPRAVRDTFQLSMNLNLDTGNTAQALAFVQACQSIPGTQTAIAADYNNAGWLWLGTFPYFTANMSYTHFNTPNKFTCEYANSYNLGLCGWGCASTPCSNHPGGVNVGFADGSVKFIKNSISLQTWWALGSRNQGEVISSDSY